MGEGEVQPHNQQWVVDAVKMQAMSDKIEKFIPPKKGTSHILRIIRELIDFHPESQKTNIAEGLRYLTNAIKKKLKLTRLDDQSRIGVGPMSSGRESGIVGIAPPVPGFTQFLLE